MLIHEALARKPFAAQPSPSARVKGVMQPVSPHRWRALPTALIVIAAIALGAVTARADEGPAHRTAASTSSAIR
jgi:hypothetical protein